VILARGEQREAVAIEPRSPAAPDSLAWLVFADRSGTAARVASELEARGRRVLVLEPPTGAAPEENGRPEERGPEAEVERAVAAALERDRLEGILFAWGLDFAGDRVSPEAIARAERGGSATLLDVLRQLDAEAPARPPRLWILAAGSRSAEGVPEQLDPLQAGLRGVARCVMNELPRFETTFVDLGRPTTEVEIASFFGELLAPDRVDEVAFRGRRRYVNRLQRVSRETLAQRAMRTLPASGASYAAAVAEPGILDSVHLRRTQHRSPAANEVEVTVHASTLNFRDVMLALGLLGDEAVEGGLFGRSLGLECAGVVSAVGGLVQDLRVGDEVLATAPACLGGRAYPLAVHCVPKPAHLTWTEAATLPVAYTTAYFSLVHHCRLQPGEKVLIHAAAGGVGIAAVRIALALGAEVLATAGTPEKRAYVASLGVPAANVMDSRTLAFADLVLEKTGGRGVDVVLNSIAGPAVHQSVRCLAAYGRFVEIGKTDIYRNSKLGLRPFGNNLTYYGVDVDRLFAQKPELAGRLFRASIAFFREHGFPPHPVTSFPVARLADAFQLMGGSRHLGKVVIGMEGEVEVAPPARHELRADGTYLVTGGASGLGLGIASWMTTRGCRNLVLLSRTGVKTAAEAAVVQRMRERGVHVVLPQGSVEDREFLDGVLRRIRDTLPPLRGVQHAAMVLDDGSIAEMDHERYMRVFRPKAIGALNLHEATRDLELDHFVCYASISGVFGNPGQVGYVAANNFLDAFSRWRRAQGLPATTIDWGVIGDVGFVARNGEIDGNVSELLNKQGWRAFSLRQAESILEQVLLSDPVEIVATDCDWGVVGAFFPHAVESSRFAHLVAEERSGAGAGVATVDSALRSTLLDAGGERAAQLLLTHLRETFGRVLGAAPSKLDPAESITRFGLDSLMANQVRNWVQAKLGIDYSMMRILRGPSLNEMVAQLLAELGGAPSADAGASAPRDELERWVHRPRPVAKPRTRLFCLPYFAGGASAFLSWHTLLPADVEVCAVQFPGREERRLDAPFDDAVALVAALARVIRPLLDAPFAIYAHSSGAGIAFELCRHLRSEYDVQPVHLMVGGWGAPHLPRTYPVFEAVDERDLHDDRNVPAIKEHMRRLEIPESVVGNDALLAEMLPALRADVLLGKRYRYREEDPLVCPITAIAGARDSVVPVDHVREWRRHTSGPFHCVVVDGAHLFCRDNKEELLRCIAAGLAPPLT
jgi:NADPH:quinone reductase-like Zn-dependent oxidoreductase/surfactin synthase thioesterase subunit